MLHIKKKGIAFILALCLAAVMPAFSGSARAIDSPDSKPLRVGYVESEDYGAFARGLAGIALGLEKRGVISGLDTSPDESDAGTVWHAMARASSSRIEFVENMFFSMKSMDEADYTRFTDIEEVDFLIVMGTVAGVYVSKHETKNDYMVLAAANPVLSGIVKSETERFKTNSYAYIDPSRFRRQVEIAYNVFGFSKLGVVYENSSDAYAYSGMEQTELAAKENGFSIARRFVDEARGQADMTRYYDELKDAYAQLIEEGIDALYITTATMEPHMLPWLLEDMVAHGIPTISQVGEEQVQNGVILGVTLEDPEDQGNFIAHLLEQYMDGAAIDTLPQVYEIVPKVFINYDAAIRSGIRLSFKTLLSMDDIFREADFPAGGGRE